MYILREISRTDDIVTAEMIPMKERRYTNANGVLIIEYYMDEETMERTCVEYRKLVDLGG